MTTETLIIATPVQYFGALRVGDKILLHHAGVAGEWIVERVLSGAAEVRRVVDLRNIP